MHTPGLGDAYSGCGAEKLPSRTIAIRPAQMASWRHLEGPDSMDDLEALCRRLTYNGAVNLRYTIKRPHPEHPDLVNGGERLYTGLGKYTTLAHIGVENHLIALKLAEWRDKRFCVTPLGRQVAQYLHDNWDTVSRTFRQ